MRVFLDTEFTSFDEPKLISLGLVTDTGQSWYAELADGWTIDDCTDFVLETVLPLLSSDTKSRLTRRAAARALADWLVRVSGGAFPVIVFDAQFDWRLLVGLLSENDQGGGVSMAPAPLSWPGSAMAYRCSNLLEACLGNHPQRHHALVDALALRGAVLQTESEFRCQ